MYYKADITLVKGKSAGRTERTTVNVPIALYEAVKKLVEEGNLEGGYVSVDEFIRDTLRKRLREFGYKV